MLNTYKPNGYTLADLIKVSQEYNCKNFKIEVAGDYVEGFFHGVVTDFYFNPKENIIILEAEN